MESDAAGDRVRQGGGRRAEDSRPPGTVNPQSWLETLYRVFFLAALSSSRSLVVRPLVGWSVRPSERFVKK